MAKAPARKSAAKTAKRPAPRPKAKAITFEAPEEGAEDPGPGAAGVEEPTLHETAPLEPEAEEPAMGEEPEAPTEPDPEGTPAPRPDGDWAARVAASRSVPIHFEDDAGTVQVARAVEAADIAMDREREPTEERPARRAAPAVAQATGEVTIPEQFLTIAID